MSLEQSRYLLIKSRALFNIVSLFFKIQQRTTSLIPSLIPLLFLRKIQFYNFLSIYVFDIGLLTHKVVICCRQISMNCIINKFSIRSSENFGAFRIYIKLPPIWNFILIVLYVTFPMVLNGVNKISLKKVSTRLSLRNGVLFVPAWVPWVAC